MSRIRFGLPAGRSIRTCALLVLIGMPATTALPARADVVTDWNAKAIELLPRMKKQGTYYLRGLAIMHAAMFDAVNAVERKYTPFKIVVTAPIGASSEAAAAAAARRVLLELVPQERDAIEAAFRDSVARIADGDAKRGGVALGEEVAVKMIAWRAADRSNDVIAYVPKAGPGMYQPTSANPMVSPHWGRVEPWVMTRGDQFRPGPPPSLDSAQWQRDLVETMTLGGKDSAKRTGEQTLIAQFHAAAEFPLWNGIARNIVAEKRLGLVASARVFALLNVAMADAHIAVYDAKYKYDFWRPATAIRAGSAGIAADPDWQPVIAVPMHPEYPCAHCTVGGAARAVLEAEFGNAQAFSVSTQITSTVTMNRTFPSFAAFAEEEAYSRILGGLHYRNSWMTGAAMGRDIGDLTVATILRPQP